MGLDQFISLLVAITLIEMMFATGLGVRLADVILATRDTRLITRAALANYVAVPLAAVVLLLAVDADPPVAVGILILAACPGAPYGPPLTGLAGGRAATAVGLMVVLAGSSVLVAPLLLALILPLVTGDADLRVDPLGLFGAILATQLLPLCVGLAVNQWRSDWAAKWLGPAVAISKILNAMTLVAILASQFPRLLDVRLGGVISMLILLALSLGAGWSAGAQDEEDRKAVALTTAIRNVGLGLEITASAFPGTSAVTAVLVYGLVQLLGSFLVALRWRRASSRAKSGPTTERACAPKSAKKPRQT